MSCKKTACLLLTAALAVGTLGGCSCRATPGDTAPESAVPPTVDGLDTEGMFTDRDMEGNDTSDIHQTDSSGSHSAAAALPSKTTITVTGDGATVNGNTVTIQQAGDFTLQGNLADGQIVIDTDSTAKVQVTLAGVNAYNSRGAALYVAQADKVFLTLKSGTQNTLCATGTFPAATDGNGQVDGALFSRDDLTLSGSGCLTVSSVGNGIVCKDSLAITGGTYTIDAEGHAIQGKDDVRIANGSFHLTAGKDGIHAENSEDTTLGFLYVAGGRYTVTADGDGLSASAVLQIDGGSGTLTTGGGAAAATPHEQGGPWYGQSNSTDTDDVSAKGMKAVGNLLLGGGIWTVDAADDAIHSNASVAVTGGQVTASTGDDGIHADSALVISDGTLTVTKSYEGLEGTTVEITGGTIDVTADDDGINAAGGNDESGFGGFGRDSFNTSDNSSYIRLSGGKLRIDAGGDGVDSNGSLYVTGGETTVAGPTNSGNGALDYASVAQISGGTFAAVGASGMATGFTAAENQGAIFLNLATYGDALTLTDSDGNILLTYEPDKRFNSVVLSCPALQKGQTYTLTVGTESVTVTLDDLLYSSGGGMGGPGGNPGGGMGGRPGGGMGKPPGGFW